MAICEKEATPTDMEGESMKDLSEKWSIDHWAREDLVNTISHRSRHVHIVHDEAVRYPFH